MRVAVIALAIGLLGTQASPVGAQVTDDNYLRYVPLAPPRLYQQSAFSERMALFGDPAAPGFRDVSPRDGVDDARGAVLMALAQRFAPFMVQNTFSVPMDHRKLMTHTGSLDLTIDAWDLAFGMRRVGRETVDFGSLGTARCPGDRPGPEPLDPGSADCRVVRLLDGQAAEPRVGSPRVAELLADPVEVMFFDLPGNDPESWKAVYRSPVTGNLRTEFEEMLKVYVHPFVEEATDSEGTPSGYRFVLQYWFYYPLNDGGNNHESDWEHINVLITPRAALRRGLTAEEVAAVLAGRGLTDAADPDQLVIDRVEYYFHHKVMTLDYTRPNAYAGREEWEQEVAGMTRERLGLHNLWRQIRRNAYRDAGEAVVNTHPIAYIGADNKGLDQILSAPGGSNQDSHGTFPFPGLYKTVGPTGSAEQVPAKFDHWAWFANGDTQTGYGRNRAVLFDRAERLEIMPDWERVLPLVRSDPVARRNWAWLVLPVRWGYPATPSPLAGLVEYADMGNVGPIGPAFNDGWNRTGPGRGYQPYEPHVLSSFFPVEAQDGFSNNLGYLNVFPAIANLPPFDFLWRVVGLPFRASLKRNDPIYYPEETVPTRFFGLVAGAAYTSLPEDIWLTVAHLTEKNALDLGDAGTLPAPLVEVVARMALRDSTLGGSAKTEGIARSSWGAQAQVAFYLGPRVVTTTGLRHARYPVGFRQPLVTGGTYAFDAELNWWDVTGNIRYNMTTGGLKRYLHAGYGLSRYRLERMTSDGEPMENATGEWITNAWPVTWQYGAGIELLPVQSFSPFPRGIDLGLRVELSWLNSPTGINLPGALPIRILRETPSRWVRRSLSVSGTVSF